MRYVLLINQGETPRPGHPGWEELTDAERGEVYAAYRALNEIPGVTSGEPMQDPSTATTVRVRDGRVLTTDGPFAEVKDAIGGFFYLEADDLDAAIEVAAKVPAAYLGGAVEIRPLGRAGW